MGIDTSNIYYLAAFSISDPTNVATQPHFNAHYFNITDVASSTSSMPSSTSSPSPKSSGSAMTTTSATSAGSQTDSPLPPSNNLGKDIGAGIGVPLGVFAIVLYLWVILQHRRKTRSIGVRNPDGAFFSNIHMDSSPSQMVKPVISPQIVELGDSSVIREMQT